MALGKCPLRKDSDRPGSVDLDYPCFLACLALYSAALDANAFFAKALVSRASCRRDCNSAGVSASVNGGAISCSGCEGGGSKAEFRVIFVTCPSFFNYILRV